MLKKHCSALGVVIVWFALVSRFQVCLSADSYQPPAGIFHQPILPAAQEFPGTAVAIHIDPLGNLYTLLNDPPRLIKRNIKRQAVLEINRGFGSNFHPTDLFSDNSRDFFVVDPLTDNIFHINSRLGFLPPIKLESEQGRIEPLSVCRDLMNGIYILNRADRNIWRVDPTGTAVKLRNNLSGEVKFENPRRIRYADYNDRIIVMGEANLKGFNRFGFSDFTIGLTVKNLVAFDISDREVWVVGDGISCVDLELKREVFVLPPDSLSNWMTGVPVDISVFQDRSLFLQSRKSNAITSFGILRLADN